MTLWVDADACPVVIKEILFRASERTQLPLVLIANRPIHIPRSKLVSMVQVGAGMDVAERLTLLLNHVLNSDRAAALPG